MRGSGWWRRRRWWRWRCCTWSFRWPPGRVGPWPRVASPTWQGYALVALLAVLAYANSLQGDFVHDDLLAIVGNPDAQPGAPLSRLMGHDFWGKSMRSPSSHKSYRPLCVLTFRLNVWLGGMHPWGFHVLNVCLHAATCVAFAGLGRSVLWPPAAAATERRLPGAPWLAAALFAVHPVHTEAVSGIVGRADVLAGLLFLASFCAYVRSVGAQGSAASASCCCCCPITESPGLLLLSLLLGGAAMLVKETGVTALGAALAYDALVLSRLPPCREKETAWRAGRSWDLLHGYKPLLKRAAVTVLWLVLLLAFRLAVMGATLPAFIEQDNPASFSPHRLTRFLTYSYLCALNAWLLLCPRTLSYDWQAGSVELLTSARDPRVLAPTGLALGLGIIAVRCARTPQVEERRVLTAGLLLLVLPFLPASNLFFRVGFVMAERILYLPSMGSCLLVTHALTSLYLRVGSRARPPVAVAALCLLALFAAKTLQRNQVWRSREALFRSGVETLPHNAKAHYNYANLLRDKGETERARQHYRAALSLCPGHASALNNLGTLAHELGHAESLYRRALAAAPAHAGAMFNLANLLRSRGLGEEAERLYRRATRVAPHFADAFAGLASLLSAQNRAREAEEVYRTALEIHANNADLHNNYGAFLLERGDQERARGHYVRATQLNPSHSVALINLGRLARARGHNREAEDWYLRCLEVDRSAEALSLLGALYYNTGRTRGALGAYSEALERDPSSRSSALALVMPREPSAWRNLAHGHGSASPPRCSDAQVLVRLGEVRDAERAVTRALALDPACIECHRLRAALHAQAGSTQQALEAVRAAIRLRPPDSRLLADLHFAEGNHLRELGRSHDALKSYHEAVRLEPSLAPAWMNMGAVLHVQGDYRGARELYERARQLEPGSLALLENLAKLERAEHGAPLAGPERSSPTAVPPLH
ncbi:protein O-mannosyl-transferase TMTC1 isoform X1 [Lampetra fluviatilis]